jgi:hypothetical protein
LVENEAKKPNSGPRMLAASITFTQLHCQLPIADCQFAGVRRQKTIGNRQLAIGNELS